MTQGNVMIVDDEPANLALLEDMLVRQGHEVRSLPLGRLALAAAAKHPPDLMLLDVNMPEMNGYEVCERLKATPKLVDVPVIFLSAMNDTQHKVKAFQSGAVDYISKPFQFEEVHARVETHLKLHELQRELKLQNERLERAVKLRTIQLADANLELADANQRLTILDTSKNEFLNLISHEFRTPLNGLLGAGEIILDGMPSSEENTELQGMFERSRHRILAILDDAMLLTQIDVNGNSFKSAHVSLHAALKRAIDQTAEFAESRKVSLTPPSGDLEIMLADENLLVRALHALLETAVKFSEGGGTVRLAYEVDSDPVRLVIESRGKTIPNPLLPKFFDLFAVSEGSTPGGDLGLGPAVACRILALSGASVSVANRDPSGIRFTVSLKDSRKLAA